MAGSEEELRERAGALGSRMESLAAELDGTLAVMRGRVGEEFPEGAPEGLERDMGLFGEAVDSAYAAARALAGAARGEGAAHGRP